MRINCISVSKLADQHLRAEWVEILMLPAYIKRTQKTKVGLLLSDYKIVQQDYVLNTGHAKFFYNKLIFIVKRYEELRLEMLKRGFQANPSLDLSMFPKELFNDWKPKHKDVLVNLERIKLRIQQKPTWYKYNKQEVDWDKFYAVI